MRVVIALGGIAIAPRSGKGDDEFPHLRRACQEMAELIKRGHQVVVVKPGSAQKNRDDGPHSSLA